MPKKSLKLQVLYEDNHLIAVNKPSGVLVQGDKTVDLPLIDYVKDYLIKKYNKKGEAYLGVPHRIDRPTSGLVLFAKTSKALPRLNKMFQEKEIQKTYWAMVKNKPNSPNGKLIDQLERNPQKNKSFVVSKANSKSKMAELDYKTLVSLEHYHLLEIYPKTGRHHQIRAQLAHLGCPIKGDLKYGFHRSNDDASIHLHARAIEFIHPVKKETIRIEAPCPTKDGLWKAAESAFKKL